MPKVEFKRVETDEEVENINIKDGQLIYSKSGKTYMDYGSERIPTGSGGSSVEVDTEMSDISENAVQNKVIKEYVDDQVSSIPEEVVIDDEEPTDSDWKIWIDNSAVTDNTYYNDNGTPTNIKTTTYDTLPVGTEVDYDGETVPSGWTEVDDKSWKFQILTKTVSLTANTGVFTGINYDNIQGTIICSFLIGVNCTTDNSLLTQCIPAETRNNGRMNAITLKSSVNQNCDVRVGVIYTED